jgi:CheY-like chemotaxis protein
MNEIERILAYHRNDSEPGTGVAERKKRVLVVEGDGFTRITLMNWLLAAGFDVDFAPNGRLGLHQLRMWRPDTLIMEINLRDLPGLELIKKARREPGFGDRPIYVFTSTHFVKRSTRKELSAAEVKVFDKLSVAPETLVVTVADELLGRKSTSDGNTTRIAAPDKLSDSMAEIWLQAKTLARCNDPKKRIAACAELRERVYSLLSHAAVGGFRKTARQAKALVDFLDHLCEQSQQVSDEALNTVARSVEVLSGLAQEKPEKPEEPGESANFKVVVVGETAASCNSIQETFQGAGIEPVSFADPAQALEHLAAEPADLIITKLSPAAQEAFDLAKLRELQLHQETPVIAAPQAVPEGGDGSLPAEATVAQPEAGNNAELLMQALNVLQKPAADDAVAANVSSEPAAPTHEVPGATLTGSGRSRSVDDGPQGRLIEPPSAKLETPQDLVAAFQPEAPTQTGVGGKPSQKRKKGTVLFVEDDPVLLKVYKRALKADGFRVEVVEDGLAAIEALPKVRPDLVILDLMLPKMHGLEVLKFIRADMNLKCTPVVVLSNAFMEGLATKAMEAGANKGVLKSECTPAKLVELVAGLVPGPGSSVSPTDTGKVEAETSFVAYGENGETSIWTRKDKSRRDAPIEIAKIRQACVTYVKSVGSAESMDRLAVLYRRVRFFGARAGLCGFTKLSEVAGAFEALLFEVIFKKVEPNASILQTMAQTVDCLGNLVEKGDTSFPEPVIRPRVLVVDDDAVCAMTTVAALKLAKVSAVGTQDPKESLQILETGNFDVVMLDVEMPEMDGYQVCEKMRRMPQYKSTPVMFFTVNGDVTRRARGLLVGGNDFAMKPITPAELILKLTLQWVKSAPAADAAAKPSASAPLMLIPTETGAPSDSGAERNDHVINTAGRTAGELLADVPATNLESGRSTTGQASPELPPSSESAEVLANGGDVKPGAAPAEGEGGADGQHLEVKDPTVKTVGGEETIEAPMMLGQSPPLSPEEMLEKYEKERQTLVTRVFNSENELHQERARVKRRERVIEKLEKQLQELQTRGEQGQAKDLGENRQDVAVPASEPTPDTASLAKQAQEAEARCRQLEGEMTELRKAREELDAKIAQEHEQSAESDRRSRELESQLAERSQDLERARAELDRQAGEHSKNEGELRAQLEAAGAAQKESQHRCSQLETEIEALRKAREELEGRSTELGAKNREFAKQSRDLEQRLQERSTELEAAKAELEKRAKEHSGTEAELWKELEAALSAQKESEGRCSQLEKELAQLRQAREELVAGSQEQGARSRELEARSKELEKQLADRSAQLEKAQAELESQVKAHQQAESHLRRELEVSATEQQQAQERCRRLEQELAELRQVQQQLEERNQAQGARSQELEQKSRELEQSLQERSADLDRTKAELERRSQDQSRTEAELWEELEKAGTAHQQALEQCGKLEKELVELHQARVELEGQSKTVEKRLAETAADLERSKAELEKQLQESAAELQNSQASLEKATKSHSEAVNELRLQLDRLTAEQKQSQTRCAELETELTALRHARGELSARITREEDRVRELDQRGKDLEQRLQERSLELDRIQEELEATGASRNQAREKCQQLEQELAELRQAREELAARTAKDQEHTSQLTKRTTELEERLRQTSRKLEQAQSEVESRGAAHARVEAELRRKLEQVGVEHKQAHGRCVQLEGELSALQQAREELHVRVAHEQGQVAESSKRSQELETRLTETTGQLEAARKELEARNREQQLAEDKLRQELETLGAAHKQAQVRCSELEGELAALQRVREELSAKAAREQEHSANLNRKSAELEARLSETAGDLALAKADLEKQGKAHAQVETELRRELETAGAEQKQSQARCSQLSVELAALRQAREELMAKMAREQSQTAASSKRCRELEKLASETAAELALARAHIEEQGQERARVESELHRQLKTSSESHHQLQEQCARMEKELGKLQQARQDLDASVAREKQVSDESARRSEELQKRLAATSAELEKSRSELRKQKREHSRAEADLKRQVEKVEANEKLAEERCHRLETELENLRHAGEELNLKVAGEQTRAAELGRHSQEIEQQLADRTQELSQTRADLEKQARAFTHVEAKLRQQLDAATTGQNQAQENCRQLQSELGHLRQAREELAVKLSEEQSRASDLDKRGQMLDCQLRERTTEWEQARAELARQAEQFSQREGDLRSQLETVTAGRNQVGERCKQLQEKCDGLQKAHEETTAELAGEQNRVVELTRRGQALENQLAERTAELDRARAEFQKQSQDYSRTEAGLRQQLETTGAGQKLAQARCVQLEGELNDLRLAREELQSHFASEQKRVLELNQRSQELEQHLKERSSELSGLRAQLEQRERDFAKAEAELWKQLETAEGSQKQAVSRCSQLEGELSSLRQAREELSGRLAQEQKGAADLGKRGLELEKRLERAENAHRLTVTEMEDRIRRGVNALTRVTSDLESERADRTRAEEQNASLEQRLQELHAELGRHLQSSRVSQQRIATLEHQLRQNGEKQARLLAELEQERIQVQLVEEQLQRANELNQRYEKNISSLGQANMVLLSSREDLQRMLESNLGILHKTEARLECETAELQRVGGELESARSRLQSQQLTLEQQEAQIAELAGTSKELSGKLQAEANACRRLSEESEAAQRNMRAQTQTIERQNAQIKETLELSKDLESRLQSEASERQRLSEELEAARRSLHSQAQAIKRQVAQIAETRELAQNLEARLQAETGECQRLGGELETARRNLQEQSQTITLQEQRIKDGLETAANFESRLQKEAADRQTLQHELHEARRTAAIESEKRLIESSRHQADLQNHEVERRRLETNVVRLRHATIKAARTGRIVRQKLRRQTGQPVETLLHSMRRMMGLESTLEQKELVEEMLEQVLLLKASIQEPRREVERGRASGSEGEGRNGETSKPGERTAASEPVSPGGMG